MVTNTLFGAPIDDPAVSKMIRIMNIAKQWGWMPHEVAGMPAEWALMANEFSSSINFIKGVRQGK